MSDTDSKTQLRWRAEARRARKARIAAIRRVDDCKCSKSKSGFRCIEWSPEYCSGEMVVRYHGRSCPIWKGEECDCAIKHRIYVGAHDLPVFVQCSNCGYAPSNDEQLILQGRILTKKARY